jgi:hypothetical protein
LKNTRFFFAISSIVFVTFILVAFQNCGSYQVGGVNLGNVLGFGQATKADDDFENHNGFGYGGIAPGSQPSMNQPPADGSSQGQTAQPTVPYQDLFENVDTNAICADGTRVRARIHQGFLVRQNCENLNPPWKIKPDRLKYQEYNPVARIFQGKVYDAPAAQLPRTVLLCRFSGSSPTAGTFSLIDLQIQVNADGDHSSFTSAGRFKSLERLDSSPLELLQFGRTNIQKTGEKYSLPDMPPDIVLSVDVKKRTAQGVLVEIVMSLFGHNLNTHMSERVDANRSGVVCYSH